MMRRNLRVVSLLVLVSASLGACTGAPIPQAELQAVLDTQREAWNRGDLEGFMATYEHGDELGFVGASGLTRGWEQTLANYRRGYPDAASRGRLDFELLSVRPLGADHAIVVGRYHLERAEPADGFFTLLVARTADGLRILHDHSSESRPNR
ncbi:MAG: DUF4440 domain-containing protein [Planctomycetes bacterium]|nr:DUF4440 domain-containing protein [Planctomycetota bacterium]